MTISRINIFSIKQCRSFSVLLVVEEDELINYRRPRAIVHEIGDLSLGLVDQLEEHVPGVLGYGQLLLLLGAQEVDPVSEELALAREEHLPEVDGHVDLEVLETLVARKVEHELVHLLEVLRLLQLLVQLRQLPLEFVGGADPHCLEAVLELGQCHDAHLLGTHFAADEHGHDVRGGVHPQVVEEFLQPLDFDVARPRVLVPIEGLLDLTRTS